MFQERSQEKMDTATTKKETSLGLRFFRGAQLLVRAFKYSNPKKAVATAAPETFCSIVVVDVEKIA